jgi:hypothetical protein
MKKCAYVDYVSKNISALMTILMAGYFGPAKPKFNEIANCVNYFPGEFTLSKTSRLHVWQ